MNSTTLYVKEKIIQVIFINNKEYISLTDIAKTVNKIHSADVIKNWLRNKETIAFLGLWERLNNENFKLVEFDQFKNEAGSNSFVMTPKKWIENTNAIGIISKAGKYNGGTYARSDIAFEFSSWISPEFKLYLIKEFERLKEKEARENRVEWHATRIISKLNYLIHTEAIKKHLIPELTESQKNTIYADEADILNVALYGMTAKEWKQQHPDLPKNKNIRDYSDLIELIIISNLEIMNAILIENKITQKERLIRLNSFAKKQINMLEKNNQILNLDKKIKAKVKYLYFLFNNSYCNCITIVFPLTI